MREEEIMIKCTLGNKTYTVDFISGRALREIGPAAEMYAKVTAAADKAINGEKPDADNMTIAETMDAMIKWFCVVFNNQFTPDDVLDNYPVDRIMHDMALTLMAVQTQTTEVLNEFPTKAAQEEMTEKS